MPLITNKDYVLHLTEEDAPDSSKPAAVILSTRFQLIGMAMEFMTLIINCWMTSTVPCRQLRAGIEFTALGRMFHQLEQFASLYSSGHRFHPLLAFFFQEYRRHPIRLYAGVPLGHMTSDGTSVIEAYDDFITALRKHATQTNLKKSVADWESKYRKNYKRLRKLDQEMFGRHSRIVAVRLDLHHKASCFKRDELDEHIEHEAEQVEKDLIAYVNGADLDTGAPAVGRVSFETVQRDRKRLFSNMKGKPSLFKHLVAYVWRIEFTPGAGYHLHVALFFDGSKVQKHEWLGQQICNYWTDVITEGNGRAHNCNMAWDRSAPGCGVGVINYYDTAKRAALLNALDYLCKRSQQVVVLPYEGCNLFGSGFVHRKVRRGGGRRRSKTPSA